MKTLLLTTLFAAALGAGCGNNDSVRVMLTFPDETIEQSTRTLLFIVREVPPSGNGCAALWMPDGGGLAENRSTIDYPNRNDVVAAPVKLTQYPLLTFLVYAYPTADTAASQPIAGGCEQIATEDTEDVVIAMQRPPRS